MKFLVPFPPIIGPSIPVGEASRPELACLLSEVDVCCAEQTETSNRVERTKAMLMWRMGALLSSDGIYGRREGVGLIALDLIPGRSCCQAVLSEYILLVRQAFYDRLSIG